MNFIKYKKLNFTQDFFEKQILSPYYGTIRNTYSDSIFFNPNTNEKLIDDHNDISVIEFIPPFIDLDLETKQLPLSSFKYKYFKGFMCELNNTDNLQDYMNVQLGKKGVKKILSRLKRLETCFDITYKTFIGDIDESECLSLMQNLGFMIEKRFKQRGDTNNFLNNWDFYRTSAYKMINDNKACLFVIYNNNKPIVISLNYLYQNIFESAISSYEIDYAKYGLGNIIVMKKLEWCFNNNYSVFNMRFGDYPYKRMWCNTVFDYESHVIYNRKSLLQTLKAIFIKNKYQLKFFLIKNKDSILVKKLKSFNEIRNKNSSAHDKLKTFTYQEVKDKKGLKELEHSEISIDENEFLRKYIYDFLYVNSTKYNSVKIYKLGIRESNTYCVKSDEKVVYFTLS